MRPIRNWTRLAISAAAVLGCFFVVHQWLGAGHFAAAPGVIHKLVLSKEIAADGQYQCPAVCITKNRMTSAKPLLVPSETARQYVKRDLGIQNCGEDVDKELGGAVIAALSVFQQGWGIVGAVGEIGIEVGCFFMNLAVTAKKAEQLFALDIFSQQHKNVDGSGRGVKETFLHNIERLGIQATDVTIFEGASTELNVSSFCQSIPQAFRLLSIDGGHFTEVVLTDMLFAECHLADGGLVLMDDYSNHFWPGVNEGVITYFNVYAGRTRLAPFLSTANKLFITTKGYHQKFYDAVTSMPFWTDACENTPFVLDNRKVCIEGPNVNAGNIWKFKLAGYPLAVAQDRGFDKPKTIQLWLDQLAKLN